MSTLQKAAVPLVHAIHQSLLPELKIASLNPHNPVQADFVPEPWRLLGCGNYAAVLCHPNYPDIVVKVYAPGRPGFEQEAEVYHRLGPHPAFSECFYAQDGVLVLKRLHGTTLYDCLQRGILIPPQVIEDINRALDDARARGLHPHDVHGRNVMMHGGRGIVVDISDFLEEAPCSAWEDLSRAYYRFYWPIFRRINFRVSYRMLNWVRWSYRQFRRLVRRRELR